MRQKSDLVELKKIEAKFSDHLRIVTLDVTDEKNVQEAVGKILQEAGKIDVLVNNAGVMIYGSVENVTIKEAQELFDVNFFGVMRVTQAVLPHMREKKSGRIIQISSRSGFRPLPSLSVYAASKFALEGLSETMAATLKPWDIHVSLIEPGPVNTELDFISPYGSKIPRTEDPYFSIFSRAGLLEPGDPATQEASEIAQLVKGVLLEKTPSLRYQTTPAIERQAAKRFVDTSGCSAVQEWHNLLFQLPPQN